MLLTKVRYLRSLRYVEVLAGVPRGDSAHCHESSYFVGFLGGDDQVQQRALLGLQMVLAGCRGYPNRSKVPNSCLNI